MYCSECGAELPENSKFCLNCGKPIVGPVKPISKEKVEWEYKDYVFTWAHKETWYRTSKYTDTGIRLDVWMTYQSKIAAELQHWYDQGWQPIGEVGPSCIRLNEFTQWDPAAAIVWAIFTAGVALIAAPLFRESITEPTEFRLKMRRPAELHGVSSTSDKKSVAEKWDSAEKKVGYQQVSEDFHEVMYWGSNIFKCPKCFKLNNPIYGNSCVNCDSKLTNADLIENPYKYTHR